jgi:plasmid maintenance system antidote protein VapI
MNEITEKLNELAEKTGSYANAARALKITPQSFNGLIHEKTLPKTETIIGICKKLNLNQNYWITKVEAMRSKGEAKIAWENIAKKFESIAASFLLFSIVYPSLDAVQCILCKISNTKKAVYS